VTLVQAIAFGATRSMYRAQARLSDKAGPLPDQPWDAWWRERSLHFRRLVKAVLVVGYLACLFLFVSAHGTQIVDYDRGVPITRSISEAGLPTPWLKVERQVGHDGMRAADKHEVQMELFTWAWPYAFLGLSVGSLYASAKGWERSPSPRRAKLVWASLVVVWIVATVISALLVMAPMAIPHKQSGISPEKPSVQAPRQR
jgi:hypothetical protein